MFHISKSYSELLIGFTLLSSILLSSCVKENINNISNNVMINQSFSVPFGLKEVTLDVPSVFDTSSIPGTYGSFYYNGRIYPNNFPYFTKFYTVDFGLHDKRAREEWIKRLVFHILVENSFPTQVYSQVYIFNGTGVMLDSAFVNGPVLVDAAAVNAQGEIEQSSSVLFDIPFEGNRLTTLKQASFLLYKGQILSQKDRNNPVRLSNRNKVKINIALQVQLEYNLKDINQ